MQYCGGFRRGAAAAAGLFLILGLLFRLHAAAHALTPAEQQQLIERIAKELRGNYVFPDMGVRLADTSQQKQRQGGYNKTGDPQAFARAVTTDLQETSHDLHLRLFYNSPSPSGSRPAGPPSPIDPPQRLPGNIGYIRVHGFPGPDTFSAPFERAMKELADTDAMIIDLRDNGGGSPQSVMVAAGYFIPKRTLVARIYSRPDDSTTEMWTAEVPGPHYEKQLYILTNRRTFSAAEAMAYHMKALGRAVTVGEASGGGAHRITMADVGNEFALAVAITKPTNVITGGDWEGVGVIPDINVPAGIASQSAQIAALKKLPATGERTAVIQQLELEIKK
jgi:retinol-binding protein 3